LKKKLWEHIFSLKLTFIIYVKLTHTFYSFILRLEFKKYTLFLSYLFKNNVILTLKMIDINLT